MANSLLVFGWICTDPWFSAVVDAVLDERYPEPSINSELAKPYRLGRIGSSNLVIHCLPEPPSPTDATQIVQSMATSFSGLEAILVTGLGHGRPSAGVQFGDLVISPLTSQYESDVDSNLTSTLNIVQRAACILKSEVGADGHWLSSNHSGAVSNFPGRPQFAQSPGSDLSDYPHLHYGSINSEIQETQEERLQIRLTAVEDIIDSDIIAAGLTDSRIPIIVVLGISKFLDSSESDLWKGYAAANVASYGKEFIQVMANNPTNSVPDLEGTEQLIPPLTVPILPSFQLHQYSRYGDATLLVIPTENTSKRKLLQEAFKQRARKDMVVHTITIASDSGVGEQPYNEAGITGAHNRISNALLRLDTAEYQETLKEKQIGTVIVASIESFIQTDNIERPADYGLVVIHNATTQETAACISYGVTVPPAYVNRARRFGFDRDPNYGRVVVGQILAAHVPGLDKANWQSVLAGHSRYDLLKDAIMQVSIPW